MSFSPLERLFPAWALKRAQSRLLLSELRAYEASASSRLRNPVKSQSVGSADTSVQLAGMSLIRQARFMEENHDIAVGILDKLVDRIVGAGFTFEPMARTPDGKPADGFNQALRRLHAEWANAPEITWELSEGMLDQLAARAWLRDGEVFLRLLTGDLPGAHSSSVPLTIQMLEADFCPLQFTDSVKRIYQGVEKNAWKRPTAYYFFREHPGNPYGESATDASGNWGGTRRIPAPYVLHPKFVRRHPQTRGVSLFHSVISRLLEVKEYDDTERVAARVAAAMVFQVRRGPNAQGKTRVSNADRQLDVAPGMVWENFGTDEWAEMIAADRPNINLEKYRNSQLRAAGSGTRSTFSDIANTYNGTFAAQRQELVTGWMGVVALRHAYIHSAVLPRWRMFVDMAIASGALAMPGAEVDPATLYRVDVRGPSMPWIDPLKEVNAAKTAVDSWFMSRAQVIRDRGGNPDDVFAQLQAEAEKYVDAQDGMIEIDDDAEDDAEDAEVMNGDES